MYVEEKKEGKKDWAKIRRERRSWGHMEEEIMTVRGEAEGTGEEAGAAHGCELHPV